jgi:hypothetical protein
MALRGDINKVLNGLVREGVISAFQTNFDGPSEALGVHVIVTPTSATNRDAVRKTVAQALGALAREVTVTVKPG